VPDGPEAFIGWFVEGASPRRLGEVVAAAVDVAVRGINELGADSALRADSLSGRAR
jgi:hypothetical protein